MSMPHLTEQEIAELRALCEKATPSEWSWHEKAPNLVNICGAGVSIADFALWAYGIAGPPEEALANAQLVAAARTALPRLLAEREELEKELAAYKRDVSDLLPEADAKDWALGEMQMALNRAKEAEQDLAALRFELEALCAKNTERNSAHRTILGESE